jgi:hypothetical protein
LTGTLVARKAVWLESLVYVFDRFGIPLARCVNGHRSRVLPADLLPRKIYCVQGQELVMNVYSRGELGLRNVVGLVEGSVPHFTTLWGWLGGAGGFALGRRGNAPAAPIAAVRVETKRRLLPGLDTTWEKPALVNPLRCQSEARFEQLGAVIRLLRTARAVASAAGRAVAFALTTWVGLVIDFDIVTGISWWARFRSTGIQLGFPSASWLPCPGKQATGSKGRRCRAATRSPPGDTK